MTGQTTVKADCMVDENRDAIVWVANCWSCFFASEIEQDNIYTYTRGYNEKCYYCVRFSSFTLQDQMYYLHTFAAFGEAHNVCNAEGQANRDDK